MIRYMLQFIISRRYDAAHASGRCAALRAMQILMRAEERRSAAQRYAFDHARIFFIRWRAIHSPAALMLLIWRVDMPRRHAAISCLLLRILLPLCLCVLPYTEPFATRLDDARPPSDSRPSFIRCRCKGAMLMPCC